MSSSGEEQFFKALGRRLSVLRKEKDLTQEQLGSKSGIDWKHIGFIEQGRMAPTVRTSYRIAKGLGIKIEELFKGL